MTTTDIAEKEIASGSAPATRGPLSQKTHAKKSKADKPKRQREMES